MVVVKSEVVPTDTQTKVINTFPFCCYFLSPFPFCLQNSSAGFKLRKLLCIKAVGAF
jgi:hypothetical protein